MKKGKELKELGIEKKYNYLFKDGKYYDLEQIDGRPIFKRVSKKEVEKKIKRAEEMSKKLIEGLDGEKLLIEILMTNFANKDFEKLYKLLFKSKRKYKPKTRADHCVDMKVGRMIIPLTD